MDTNEITLTADGMDDDGSLVKITEEGILCNGEERETKRRGTKLKNYEVGIAVEEVTNERIKISVNVNQHE